MNNGKNIVKDGLVLWLDGKDFTNSPQTNPLLDRSGQGNNATPSGFAYTTSSGSNEDSGIVFDGVDDYVKLEGTSTIGINPLDLDDSFSISLLAKFNTTEAAYLVSNYQGTSPYLGNHINFYTTIEGGKIQIKAQIDDNVHPTNCAGSSLNINEWYYLTLVRDKGVTLKIYVNEIEDISETDVTTGSILSNRDWVISGRIYDGNYRYFNGELKDIKFYNRALSSTEITQNYNATK